MYAVIRTGGKQYRVKEGDVIEVDHLSAKGKSVSFAPVLVVTDDGKTIHGSKDLKAYTVSAKIVGDAKGDKIQVQKYRPKSGYIARAGHRQLFSLIEIASIGPKRSAKPPTAQGDAEAKAPAESEEKEAPAAKAPAESKEKEAPAAKAPAESKEKEAPA